MNDLKIAVFSKQSASVEGRRIISINEPELNYIFRFLFKDAHSVYFLGTRFYINYDEQFDEIVFYLCEEMLYAEGDPPALLLIKIKESSLLFNRNLLTTLWNYYTFPAFIISYVEIDEKHLIKMISDRAYPDQIVTSIDRIAMFYPPHNDSEFFIIKSSNNGPDLFKLNGF